MNITNTACKIFKDYFDPEDQMTKADAFCSIVGIAGICAVVFCLLAFPG